MLCPNGIFQATGRWDDMAIGVATFGVTFAVALVGIFLDVSDLKVKVALAALAAASFLLAILVEIQSRREADFAKRALERLIQASTPSDLFAEAVKQIVIGEGTQHGFPQCLVLRRERGNGYVFQTVFTDESGQKTDGYFEFDHEVLARWSLVDEARLSEEVTRAMFEDGPVPTADPTDSWNALVDFLGTVGKALYPDAGGETFGVSADVEAVEIGLPYPPGVSPVGSRVKQVRLAGKPTPFLIWSGDELAELSGQSYVEASRTLARWLEASWGTPTVLAN